MYFLNSGMGYALFLKEARKKYYVDKSLLIDEVYRYAQEVNAYICITRPRRFGKSVAANMIAAFFEEGTREEILSAMVVYGFLTYYDKGLRIPNHELMLKFRQALASEPLGLNQTLGESRRLLEATLDRREGEVARLLEDLHDEKIPFFVYNDENSLACVVTVGYLSALDEYRITREDKAGKGYVDFLFEPMKKSGTAMILELKYNRSAGEAIRCIREREYAKRLKDYEDILLVGINYSESKKKHTCIIEKY